MTTPATTIMDERYQEQEQLGRGGFGRVVRAWDSQLERQVAIKHLDPGVAELSDSERERFKQEAKILARLSHPNIPAIYDIVFEPEAEDFRIIFEYIEGTTLAKALRPHPLGLDEALERFVELGSALHHAHELGIVHRDVKPANIMIRKITSSCCLVDFGIAFTKEVRQRLTKRGYFVGTEGYMSPEQEAGEDVDQRADIYSLGVCLYESLSGQRPDRNSYRKLSIIEEITVPEEVDTLVLRCLSEDRDERPANVTAFLQELESASRPKGSLASVLVEGRLVDLQLQLRRMKPDEFATIPAGQRRLIVEKAADLVPKAAAGRENLALPLAAILKELIRLGTALNDERYDSILRLSVPWATSRDDNSGSMVRNALTSVATHLSPELQRLTTTSILRGLRDHPWADDRPSMLFELTTLLSALMANPDCKESDIEQLAEARRAAQEALNRPRERADATQTPFGSHSDMERP